LEKIIISKDEARKYLLYKQGLLGKKRFCGKEGILEFFENILCLQYDPIDVCGKNAEIILQSRVDGFKKEFLEELLYKERDLIDYWDKNMSIIRTKDWKYFSFIRKKYQNTGKSIEQINSVKNLILEKIEQNDIVTSKDFDFNVKTDWHWNNTNLGRAALETLYYRGDLVIHHKDGNRKYYGLAERYIPQEILKEENPLKNEWEFFVWRIYRRIKSVGLLWNRGSDAWLNIDNCSVSNRNKAFLEMVEKEMIQEIFVENTNNSFYLTTEDKALLIDSLNSSSYQERMEFIAPLDNMMWDRKLIYYLFGFQYKWEIYTPQAKRKYGYYVLPILLNDRLIGRIEVENRKKEHTLDIKNIWIEQNKRIPEDLFKSCINRFAEFNNCECIKYHESF